MADFKLRKNPETGDVFLWEPGNSDWQQVQARRDTETGNVFVYGSGDKDWRDLGYYNDTPPNAMQTAAPAAPEQPAQTFNAPAAPSSPPLNEVDLMQAMGMQPSPVPDALPGVAQPVLPDVPAIAPVSIAQPAHGFMDPSLMSAMAPEPIEAPEQGPIYDPFAQESMADLAKRRGQQFAAGATDVAASVPEALAVAGAGNPNTAALFALETVQAAEDQIAAAEARLAANPDMGAEDRSRIEAVMSEAEQQIAAYQDMVDLVEPDQIKPDAQDRDLFKAGQKVRDASGDYFGRPDPRDTSFWGQFASGAGNMTGFVAGSILTGPVGTAGLGSALNSSQIYKEARAAGATEEVAKKSASWGGVLGLTEVVPIQRALKLLPPKLRGEVTNKLLKRLVQVGQSGGEEAMQEAVQGIGNNLIAKMQEYDTERGLLEDVGTQALIGFILGGGVNVAGQTIDAVTGQQRDRDEDEGPEQPTEPEPVEEPDGDPLIDAMTASKPETATPEQPEQPESDSIEILDEVETVDGETRETGGKVRFDNRTGQASPVEDGASSNDTEAVPSPSQGVAMGSSPSEAGQVDADAGTIRTATLSTDEVSQVETDAETFQYKADGDQDGVTERLQGVRDWDERSAMGGIIYEYADGRRVSADGHQRLGLAKRLQSEGKSTPWTVEVIREVDGFSPEDVRRLAALKNIREGSGTALDAAKVLRDSKGDIDSLNLPPKSALVRDAKGLSRLSDDAFGAVINGVIPESYGAVVGEYVEEANLHASVVDLLARIKPDNARQAAMIAQQAGQESITSTQTSLFGEETVAENLYLERAKVLDSALSAIKKDRATFKVLADRAEAIQSEGNKLNSKANTQRVQSDSELQAYLQAEANRKGRISDALSEAAKQFKAEPRRKQQIVQGFIESVRAKPEDVRPSGATPDKKRSQDESGPEGQIDPASRKPAKDSLLDAMGGEPAQPDKSSMTDAQRAEIEARQKQSKMGRLDGNDGDAGSLFDTQGDMLDAASTPDSGAAAKPKAAPKGGDVDALKDDMRSAWRKREATTDSDSFIAQGPNVKAASKALREEIGYSETNSFLETLEEEWAKENPSPKERSPSTRELGEPDSGAAAKPQKAKAPKKKAVAKRTDSNSSLTAEESARKAELIAKMTAKAKTQLNAGLDPEMVSMAVELTGIYIKSGARKFRSLVQALMDDLGWSFSEAQPYARLAYNQNRDDLELSGDDISDMNSSAEVMDEIKSIRAQEAESDAPSNSDNLERDSGDAAPSDGLGDADVSTTGKDDGESATGGTEATDGRGRRRAGGGSVSKGDAAGVGAGRNQKLSEKDGAASGASRDKDSTGSRSSGKRGLPDDERPDSTTTQNATDGTNVDRGSAQKAADKIPVKFNDENNIRDTLPLLMPEQQDDVVLVERRYSKPDGHGMLLTNGTGTGKTYSGGGVIKRFVNAGKDNILIAAPDDGIMQAWVGMGGDMGIPITPIKNTKDAGQGVVVTTYANLGQNNAVTSRDWDLIVTDEAHKLSQNAEGGSTLALKKLRTISNRPNERSMRGYTQYADEWAAWKKMKDGDQKSALLGQLKRKNEALAAKYENKPRSKVLFLSATPFSYDKAVDYAEGYLFDYGKGGTTDTGSRQDGRSFFFVENFGYRIRNHKLTKPEGAVDSAVFEREFHERLKKEGALAGRSLTVSTDYDRKFVAVDSEIGSAIDAGLKYLSDRQGPTKDPKGGWGAVQKFINRNFKYHRRMQLLEQIKATKAVDDIRQHLDMGRKVVVFHDFNQGGGINPFLVPVGEGELGYGEFQTFLEDNPLLAKTEFHKMKSPLETMKAEFGDAAAFYNGTVSKKERRKNITEFNRDGSDTNLIVVQADAGSAGISLHDTTGDHQRVLLNLGMPPKPTTALQEEGRIRRVGVETDAPFRYYTIGTAWERNAFADKIAGRSGTVENLALGNEARAIRDSFIDAFSEAAENKPSPDDGKGGMERDRADYKSTPYEQSKTHYFGKMKQSSRRDQRKGNDWYSTPEPLGFKMVEWAGMRANEKSLEPSVGDGAISRYFPDYVDGTIIDNSAELLSRARLRANGARAEKMQFEDFHISNKYDTVVMNPPFGSGGKLAYEHLRKALRHTRPGGRVVALVPTGPAADKQFEKMMAEDGAYDAAEWQMTADISLPAVTFERAGTKVATRVFIFDRVMDPEKKKPTQHINLKGSDDINGFFDRLEGIAVNPRVDAIGEAGAIADAVEVAEEVESARRPEPPTLDSGSAEAFDVFEFNHTQTGEKMFGAQVLEKLGDKFRQVASIAKQNGGFYSRYRNKAAGIRAGFVFPTDEQRRAFMSDLAKPVVSKDQRPLDDMFYSPVLRAVQGAKAKKAKAQDWKAIIGKSPGVKAVEIEWLGLDEFLDAKDGTIGREEIEQFVKGSQIKIVETTLQGEERSAHDFEVQVDYNNSIEPDWDFEREAYLDEARAELEDEYIDEHGEEPESDIPDDEVAERAEALARERYEPTEFAADVYDKEESEYVASGFYNAETEEYSFAEFEGSSYEDIVEEAAIAAEEARESDGPSQHELYTEDGGSGYREILLRMPKLHEEGPNKGQDKSSFAQSAHFSDANIVVHARVKDREGLHGEKVLFVEEIQSDLGTKWRDNKPEAPEVTAERRRLEAEQKQAGERLDAASSRLDAATDTYARDPKYASEGRPTHAYIRREAVLELFTFDKDFLNIGSIETSETKALVKALKSDSKVRESAVEWGKARNEYEQARAKAVALGTEKSTDQSLPETPFKQENTYALMVKRLLRIAAQEGYDRLSWTPGHMQAARWDKAAQNVVEGVEWNPAPPNQRESGAIRLVKLEMAEHGNNLVWVDRGGQIVDASERLDGAIGDSLQKLLGQSLATEILETDSGEVDNQKITFGDSGYAVAYDQQIKRAVDKLAKKSGSRTRVDKSLPDFGAKATPHMDIAKAIGADGLSDLLRDLNAPLADEADAKIESQAADFIRVQEDNLKSLRDGRKNPPDYISDLGDYHAAIDAKIETRERNLEAIDTIKENSRVKEYARILGEKRIREASSDIPKYSDGDPVWSIEITPELRESAMGEMPMLRKGRQEEIEGAHEAVQAAMPRLRAELDRLNLSRVNLGIDARGARRQGGFTMNALGRMDILIGAALNPDATLYHEAIHAMRAANLFTGPEWKALEVAASREWIEKHDIFERYPDLSPAEQIEEAIAEEFALAMTTKAPPKGSILVRAFNKIGRLLKSIRNAFSGAGFQTAEQVFGRAYAGEIGARGVENTGILETVKTSDHRAIAEITALEKQKARFEAAMDKLDSGKFDEKQPERAFSESKKLGKARDALAERLAKQSGGVELSRDKSEVSAVVHPSLDGGAGWRVTYFDNRGFSGHSEYGSKVEALRNALSDGYDKLSPGRLKKAKSNWMRVSKDQRGRAQARQTPQARAHRATTMMGSAAFIPNRGIWDELTRQNTGIMNRLRGGADAAYDRADKARQLIQDRFLPVLRAQQAVTRETGQAIAEDQNTYLAEETFSGKVGRHLFEIDEDYTKPIIELMAGDKAEQILDADEVGTYLYARHAKERNKQIAAINLTMPDGGSGMTDAEADAVLMDVHSGPNARRMKAIARIIDDLRKRTLDLRLDSGLLTPQEADIWKLQYKYYVPLKGFAETDMSEAYLDVTGVGRRFSTRGAETKKALGRKSEAFSPLQGAITQAQEVAIRAEKNRVGNALYKLVKQNPAPNMWKVKTPKTKRYYNKTTGLVETRTQDPVSLFMDPNETAVKVNGKEHRIIFHDDRLARAAGSVGADQMGWFMGLMSMAARYFSAVNTMLDPEFVIRNAIRDMQAAQINIRNFGKDDANQIGKAMLKNWPKAFAGAYRGQLNKADSEWTKYYKEFEQSGAKVSFWKMEQPEAEIQDLSRRVKMAGGNILQRARKFSRISTRDNPVLGFIERTNLAVDNAVRLAAYVEARKRGWSKSDAASLSKNLTVNFNRRGEWGATINALYPFANAGIQGTQILFRAMSSKRMAKLGASLVASGAILDQVNSMLSAEDDDGELAYDKIPDWKNQMNMVVMLGPEADSAVTAWMPYGYNLFPYMGQQASKVFRGVKSPGDAMADFASAAFGAFSPMGGRDLQSIITPTMLDPISEMYRNEDWLGRPIRPESPYSDYGPHAYKFYGGASTTSKMLSDVLNRSTGGDIGKSGWADVSPEYIDHAFGFASGGAGRFIGRSTDTAAKLLTGEADLIESRNVPFYRSVQTATGTYLDRERYYRFRDEVKGALSSRKTYAEAKQPIPEDVKRAVSLSVPLKEVDKVLRAARKRRAAVIANETLDARQKAAQLKRIEEITGQQYIRFNKLFLKRFGPQGE